MPLPIPARPQEITAAFVNELVAESRPGVTVRSLNIVGIKSYGEANNAASVSTSAQVKLEVRYGGVASGLPERLLAKISFPADMSSSNPVLDVFFENEVRFYTRLRGELDIETPLSLGGRFDPQTKRFAVLMEDLSARSPHINSMMDEDDTAVIEGVLDTLAKLHAHYWRSPRFDTDLSWVESQVEGSIEGLLDEFIKPHVVKELDREKFKREFAQETGMTAAEMHAGMRALKRHQATLPQTFLHGDAHFGNTYAMPTGIGGVLDWQLCARGFLMHDVGYFIQTALSVEGRRKQERELLGYYRDRLCSYDVKDVPDMATLWYEYRLSMLYGFYMGWLTAPRENYGWEVIVIGNHRTKAAFQDHGGAKLIAQIM